MKLSSHKPTEKHHALRGELLEAIRKYMDDIPMEQILALLSHLVGQIIAMQDGRKMTMEMVSEIVESNINQGNKDVADSLLMKDPEGSA